MHLHNADFLVTGLGWHGLVPIMIHARDQYPIHLLQPYVGVHTAREY
jgi:hypothetical protein